MTAETLPQTQQQATPAKSKKPNPQQAVQLVQQALAARKDMIAKVLPKHLTPERMFHLVAVAMSRNPLLMQCTTVSIVQSIMSCSELGLEPTGTYGGAWLVPYKNNKTGQYEAQFQVDYRGLLELARRSGQIQRIAAHVVYEKDHFELEYGDTEKVIHRPYIDGDPGPMRGVYAVVLLKDGASQTEYMSKHQVEKIRERSKAKDSGPWKTDYDQMARKTVLRRIFNYLPRSVEVRRAIELEEEDEDAIKAEFSVLQGGAGETSEEKSSRTKSLKERVKAQLPPGQAKETAQAAPETEPAHAEEPTGEELENITASEFEQAEGDVGEESAS